MANFNVDRITTSTVRVHEILPKIIGDILTEKQIVELLGRLVAYPAQSLISPDPTKEVEYKRVPQPQYEKLDID